MSLRPSGMHMMFVNRYAPIREFGKVLKKTYDVVLGTNLYCCWLLGSHITCT